MKEGWEIIDLGSVCHVQRGLTYSGKDTVDISDQVVLRATNIDLGTGKLIFDELKYLREDLEIKPVYALKKDSLLICFSSGSKSHLGKIALVDDNYPNFFFGGFIGQINPSEKIDSKYLFYCLSSETYKDYISNLTDGVNINNLKATDLKSFQIPLPPLPEQQRIVSILDQAFAAIDKAKANAEQNLKNAAALFDSYLQGVFDPSARSGQGDGWEEKRFEELIQENQIGLIKSKKEQSNDKPYRYLKMDSITSDNNLIHDRYVYVDADKGELEKYTLNEGDFLFNTRNSYDLVGKTCVFSPIDDEPTLFNNNIMRVVFMKGISSGFINYAFSSELVKERLQKLKSGTTSVVGIYYKVLRNLKIPVTEYEEQQAIVRQLDALRVETQKLEAVYQKKMDDLEELKKSILQKAFAGELETEKAAIA